MDPLTLGSLLGAGSSILGSVIGAGEAEGAKRDAAYAYDRAMKQIAGLDLPTLEELTFGLSPEMLPEYLGGYTPELEQLIQADPSVMENVLAQTDPRLKEMQMKALEDISGIAEAGGLTEADKAALEQVRRQAMGQEQAQQQAILQEMARRGQGGSGAELIARLKGAQAAADRAGAMGLDIAQMAQQRQMQAMQQAMAGSGQARQQEFGELSDVARARDVVNQFNTQLQAGTQQRNVGARNTAAQMAAQEKQRIAEQQAALRRAEEEANIGAKEKRYGYEKEKAGMMSDLYAGQAGRHQQEAAGRAQLGADLGGIIGKGFSDYFSSQKK